MKKERLEPQLPVPFRMGKDEMNLAENPFAWLTDRPDPSVKTLKFNYPIQGKKAIAEWCVTGSDEYGLPLPGDEDILLVLIQMTRENGLEDRNLPITRYEILRRLKGTEGPFSGAEYGRVREALFRLKGVSIYATHWFDNALKKHLSYAGSIIDEVVLIDELPGRKLSTGQRQLPLSYVVWNERIFKSFQSGYIKKLDFEVYRALSRPIAKKLYRYLDKKFFDGKPQFEMNLRTLAYEHVGIQRSYRYDSELKKTMRPAHEELKKKGCIAGYDFRKSPEGTIVVYYAPVRGPEIATDDTLEENDRLLEEEGTNAADLKRAKNPTSLVDELVRAGVTRHIAERLVKEHPEAKIREKLTYADYPSAARPGAYLRTAIEEDWDFSEVIRKVETRRDKKQKQAEKIRQVQESEEEEEKRAKARQEQFQAFLKGCTEEKISELQRRAETAARERHPHAALVMERGKGIRIWKTLVRSELEHLVLDNGDYAMSEQRDSDCKSAD